MDSHVLACVVFQINSEQRRIQLRESVADECLLRNGLNSVETVKTKPKQPIDCSSTGELVRHSGCNPTHKFVNALYTCGYCT